MRVEKQTIRNHLFLTTPLPLISLPSFIFRQQWRVCSDILAYWNTGRVRSAGSRRDIDLQCLLRSIATPITTEPSVSLSLSFTLSLSFFSARTPFSRCLISSSCYAVPASDYQYRHRYIPPLSFPFPLPLIPGKSKTRKQRVMKTLGLEHLLRHPIRFVIRTPEFRTNRLG